jgi:hypothetical protein
MSAPSIAARAVVAIGPARRAGTPAVWSWLASRPAHSENAARAAPIRSSAAAVSRAMPATGQPAEPPETCTDWRHRSMNQASTPGAVSAGQARRCVRTCSEVQLIASWASCFLPPGKWW